MRLGLSLGYTLGGDTGSVRDVVDLVTHAERLGYAVAWAAEAYGSDAPTVLGYLAARTERIDLGAAVMQMPARSPAMTAMTAASLDLLSGGRFRLGLGVSGPQVSEGWHGVAFARPLARTREYLDVVRQALAHQKVQLDGEFFTLPLPGGEGKALRLALHTARDHIPTYLAAVGPKNVELAGELADGWLAIFFSPDHAADSMAQVRAGQARAARTGRGFDVSATVPVSIGPDVAACADPIRAYAALYVGGMGSREHNFYHQLAVRMGFAEAAHRIQELFLSGQHRAAMSAVPLEFIDHTSLLGPPERIVDRLHAFAAAGVTTLTVTPTGTDHALRLRTLEQVAAALDASGLAD